MSCGTWLISRMPSLLKVISRSPAAAKPGGADSTTASEESARTAPARRNPTEICIPTPLDHGYLVCEPRLPAFSSRAWHEFPLLHACQRKNDRLWYRVEPVPPMHLVSTRSFQPLGRKPSG